MLVCAKQGSALYYVYLIESLSAGRQRYVGMTDDLRQRLREHNAGESSYTAKFRPWKLIPMLRSLIQPKQKLSSVTSNLAQAMRLRVSGCGSHVAFLPLLHGSPAR